MILFSVIISIILISLFYASYSIKSGIYIRSFCRNKAAHKKLLLSFDDGPHPIYTSIVLDILDKYDIKAIFFIIGKEALKHPDIVKQIHLRGHIIGNHTYSHNWKFTLYNKSKVSEQINKTTAILENIIGTKIEYFRVPFGVTNPNIAFGINNCKLKSIGWSIRSLDTCIKAPDDVSKRVISKLHNGAIILLHDSRPNISVVLEMIIKQSYNKGFSFVSLQQLMNFN